MFKRIPDNAIQVFVLSTMVSTVILLGIYSVAVLIYKKSGWKPARRYIWAIAILTALCFAFEDLSLHRPILTGFSIAYAIALSAIMFFIGYHYCMCQKYKSEVDGYIESEIDAMLPAPDEELLKIKKTMGYRRGDPNYEKMNGYLEREELTRRWKIKKRLELRDPFMWKKFK